MNPKKRKVPEVSNPTQTEDSLSAPLPRGAGRPPVRRNYIFEELRHQIVSGKFAPGSRFWTLRDICKQFEVSPTTVQRVLQDLTKAGFIYAKGARGTFVHEAPQFMNRYAVVCFDHGDEEVLYFKAIRQETKRLQQEGGSLDLIELPRVPLRNGGVADLESLVSRRLYRGLIFDQPPDHLLGTEILDTSGVGRLSLSSRTTLHENMHSISPSVNTWIQRALERLRGMGGKKVGLFFSSLNQSQITNFSEKIVALGMQTHRTWIHAINLQSINLSDNDEASRLTELLFSLPEDRRPDVLLVADDNLIAEITLTLKTCGIQVPIISHCNYPMLPKVHTPVTWLGYDITAMLAQAIRQFESETNPGESPVNAQRLIPLFEDELATSSRAIISRNHKSPVRKLVDGGGVV